MISGFWQALENLSLWVAIFAAGICLAFAVLSALDISEETEEES